MSNKDTKPDSQEVFDSIDKQLLMNLLDALIVEQNIKKNSEPAKQTSTKTNTNAKD